MKREQLGSRLGFIMLSAGCAIGCGNVWKFPWMCGQNGGGSFMLVYILCLILLGIPALVLEFSIGRAAQASPLFMYKKLEKPGQKWGIFGWFCLAGNIALMAFYTVVSGWIIYYFFRFLTGNHASLGFGAMISSPSVNVLFLLITLVVAFFILSFNLQGGLERVTKYMMSALLVLMLALAVHSLLLGGAGKGMSFYLKPDFSKIKGSVVVGAMNQAFFTLSTGMGGMAIFGSYIGKERSLMGEAIHVIILDSLVAFLAGVIIFPACFTYNLEVTAGPSLMFDT
ncbi:MAG: sodium-dependent transporter, partial [Anaerotignum faecicola]